MSAETDKKEENQKLLRYYEGLIKTSLAILDEKHPREHSFYEFTTPAEAAAAIQAQSDPRLTSRGVIAKVSKVPDEQKALGTRGVLLQLKYNSNEGGSDDLSDVWSVVEEKKKKGGLIHGVLKKGIEVFL